jgi:glycosyltransferase involved in cell wall biosynthesis
MGTTADLEKRSRKVHSIMAKIKAKKRDTKISSATKTSKPKARPAVSVIVTVLNEEKTILLLLNALRKQEYPINELIITDGGSIDNTPRLIKEYAKAHPDFSLQFTIFPGNRSQGRNKAIEMSRNELIAITDAGCFPHSDWLGELVKAGREMMRSSSAQDILLAGYYDADPKTPFEEAVVPYVLVMPDKVDQYKFLPATRSVLFTRSTWEKVGRFDETLADNEDYPFARKAQKLGIQLGFTSKAKVTWMPRQNVPDFANMIFRYARGDAYSGAWRPKVFFLFARYILGGLLFLSAAVLFPLSLAFLFCAFIVSLSIYSAWAIRKNIRYAPHGWYWLPVLQIIADLMVMAGTVVGFLARMLRFRIIAPHLKT